ncbi:hypothetical protein HOG47_06955 [archaeon]|nr:hypothetical protein [archaeon]
MKNTDKEVRDVIENLLPDEEPLQKLSNLINITFSGFGFPKRFINSRINKNGDLILKIGWRDLHLDKNANFIGNGTDLELLDRYKIIEI